MRSVLPITWPGMFWWTILESIFKFGPQERLNRTIDEDTRDLNEQWASQHPDEPRDK